MCLCVKVTNREEKQIFVAISLLTNIVSCAFRPRQNTKFTPQSILIDTKAVALANRKKKQKKKQNILNKRSTICSNYFDLLYLLVHFTFRKFCNFQVSTIACGNNLLYNTRFFSLFTIETHRTLFCSYIFRSLSTYLFLLLLRIIFFSSFILH